MKRAKRGVDKADKAPKVDQVAAAAAPRHVNIRGLDPCYVEVTDHDRFFRAACRLRGIDAGATSIAISADPNDGGTIYGGAFCDVMGDARPAPMMPRVVAALDATWTHFFGPRGAPHSGAGGGDDEGYVVDPDVLATQSPEFQAEYAARHAPAPADPMLAALRAATPVLPPAPPIVSPPDKDGK